MLLILLVLFQVLGDEAVSRSDLGSVTSASDVADIEGLQVVPLQLP